MRQVRRRWRRRSHTNGLPAAGAPPSRNIFRRARKSCADSDHSEGLGSGLPAIFIAVIVVMLLSCCCSFCTFIVIVVFVFLESSSLLAGRMAAAIGVQCVARATHDSFEFV